MLRKVAGIVSLMAVDSSGPRKADAANIIIAVEKDDGGAVALSLPNVRESNSDLQPGLYDADYTAAEADGYKLTFSGKSSTPGVSIVSRTWYTTPARLTLTAGGIATTAYATANDLIVRFGVPLMVELTNFGPNATSVNMTALENAIASASSDIDQVLRAAGYVLPVSLAGVDAQVIFDVCLSLSLSKLYRNRPGRFKDDEGRPTRPGGDHEKEARDTLRLIRYGDIKIDSAKVSRYPSGIVAVALDPTQTSG